MISGNLPISGTAGGQCRGAEGRNQLDSGIWVTATGTTSWSVNLNSSNFLNGPHVISRARDGHQREYFAYEHRQRLVFQRARQLCPAHQRRQSRERHRLQRQRLVGGHGLYLRRVWLFRRHDRLSRTTPSAAFARRRNRSTSASITARRSGGFYYEFDCPEGVYQITLLEAETYWSGPGKREFNVFIQGRQVLTNFDIYAAAGGMNIPITLVFTNAVTNSQLQILFTPGAADNARVSGVQVRQNRRRVQRHRRHSRLVAAGLFRPRARHGERPVARLG